MIEIQIAGAGAGKTYKLSERIIKFHSLNTSHKIIYAITYTNAAKKKIVDEIIKQLGYLPDLIRIETVHSFFLNEIIYPYSHYTIAEKYNNAGSHNLPSVHSYRNKKISMLKDRLIIHNDMVFKKAMIVIDRSNSKHSNKTKREKVDFVISHINAKISHIFVDEAQDLDDDALHVFRILGENQIEIYMIGDPKQAIKFPGQFRQFVELSKGANYTIVPKNNVSKRVPENILKLSNLFCLADEMQTNSIGKLGSVKYILSTNPEYHNIINHYKSLEQLIYIEEKEGCYNTHANTHLFLPLTLEEKLLNYANNIGLDGKLFAISIVGLFMEKLLVNNPYNCIVWFQKTYDIELTKQEYAELLDNLKGALSSNTGMHIISSIEAVKGLEAETCIFILNQTMFDYLTKNISKDKYYNKNWNKIYVALTRSSNNLIFAVDKQLFTRSTLAQIETYFKSAGISEMKSIC